MSTLSEITKALEAAVSAVGVKKSAADAAKKAAEDAQSAYTLVVHEVQKLHDEYSKIMKDILSFGGTVHR